MQNSSGGDCTIFLKHADATLRDAQPRLHVRMPLEALPVLFFAGVGNKQAALCGEHLHQESIFPRIERSRTLGMAPGLLGVLNLAREEKASICFHKQHARRITWDELQE